MSIETPWPRFSPVPGVESYEEIMEVYDSLNHWIWPEALGQKPEGWDGMSYDERIEIIEPISRKILNWAGEKGTLRYHHIHNLHSTDKQFDDWWDSQIEADLETVLKEMRNISETIEMRLERERYYHRYWHRVATILFTIIGGEIGAVAAALIVKLVTRI